MPGRQRGFTLLEILIALAIVSVALAAVMRTTGMLTTNNGILRERALALLSAQNRLIELQLAPPALTASRDRGACPQGALNLVCESRYADARQGAREVTVEVYLDARPASRLATLSGVIDTQP
ncbi:type II secretion system protein GspI [Achromobacter sp. UMC71]|nr:type II secretion system protein GspI [Achromobacter sp. UMC71]